MLPLWVIYISVAGVSSVLFNYLNRYVLKDGDDSTSYAWWFEVFRTAIFLPFCFIVARPQFNFANLFLFLLIGLAEFFGVYIYMKMHSMSELSTSTVISQLRLVWIPIIAYIFLKEQLTVREYVGIILVIVGQAVVVFRGKLVINRSMKYMILSSLLVAIGTVLTKKASPVFDAPLIVVAMGLPTILLFPLFMQKARGRIRDFGKRRWKKIGTAAIFNALTMLFMVWALKFGPVSKVVGVFQGMSVLGVLVGIIFLNEKGNLMNKIFGSVIVLLGMFLLV